ncbi:MAG: restriction endonuclease subunit S [Methanobacteriaceae archaeon]|nr:restriction endonuclease subunit S [Methanobacteriaceae archaeon]
MDTYSFDGEAILIPGDGKIGKVYHYINGKFDYHQRVYKISDFEENIMGKYIYYYLQKNFLKQALKHSAKATVDSLRLPTIKNMPITFPILSEQEKIANFLSKVDNKISMIKEQLTNMEDFKKGLLQQMFI